MDTHEKILLQACQRGNSDAFGKIYDLYIDRIYRFIYYKTHHKETAEDLTSQTFFKALEHIQDFDPERNFSAWLYRIARNVVIDYYRKKRPSMVIDDEWDIKDDHDFQEELDRTHSLRELKSYIERLPSIQRDIIVLRVWEDMSYKQISEIVGKSESNCKVIFSRAVNSLKKTVSPALIAFFFLMLEL